MNGDGRSISSIKLIRTSATTALSVRELMAFKREKIHGDCPDLGGIVTVMVTADSWLGI